MVALIPNHIEFVANSTLLGGSVPNHIEFVENSLLLGETASKVGQFDTFGRKFSSKRRINFVTFRRMASKSVEYIVCWAYLR